VTYSVDNIQYLTNYRNTFIVKVGNFVQYLTNYRNTFIVKVGNFEQSKILQKYNPNGFFL